MDRSEVGIAFNLPDKYAINVIKQYNIFWIGSRWDEHTGKLIRGVMEKSFEIGGDSLPNIAKNLKLAFSGIQQGTDVYWTKLADHFDTTIRELGKLVTYEEMGAEYLVVRAWIDSSTTPFCRAVNGKVLKVSDLIKQRNEYLAAVRAKDAEAVKRIWPMKRDAVNIIPNKIGMPPYHFGCRTITVMKI